MSASGVEQFISDELKAGRVAMFSGGAKPTIDATLIESLATIELPRGIRIGNVRIPQTLDLRDSSIAAIEFEDCELGGVLQLAGSRLGRLSIRGSKFSGLNARGAAIAGEVDFSRAGPMRAESWVDLSSAEIRGSIDGCDSDLNAPQPRPNEEVLPWAHHYALRISDSHIRGRVLLNGSVVIRGGFCLDNAHVRGSVWCRGATIIAGEGDNFHPGDAVHGHCAEIEGMLALCFGFKAEGRVWMLGARIGDRVTVGFNAELKQSSDGLDRNINHPAPLLLLDQARIDGWVRVDDFISDGGISMNHARIGAGLVITNGHVAGTTAGGAAAAIDLLSTQIDGNVLIGNRLIVEGCVLIAHARIHGQLDCRGAAISNKGTDGQGLAIDGAWLRATDGALPQALERGDPSTLNVEGRINLANAQFGCLNSK